MKKKIIFSFISISLLLTSCSFEQDPLASFPKEIREGRLPEDNRVLKPIPRGAIQVESIPESPLVFHNEPSVIGIDVRLLQSFQAPYTIDILNLNNLPGEARFDAKKNQINWVPDLSKLQDLFEYIPIHIRISFQDPRPLYVEHTIYVRSYRTLLGLKLEKFTITNFIAGSKKVAKVIMIVKDLDVNLKLGERKAKAPHIMITQGAKNKTKYLLPYLKALPRPRLKSWRDPSLWVVEAHFDLKTVQLAKGTTFDLNYEVFSSFGKSFGLKTEKVFVEQNVIVPKPPTLPTPPKKTPPKKTPPKTTKEVK